MTARLESVLVAASLVLASSASSEEMKQMPRPPVATMKVHDVRSPNGTRADEYYWLRDDTRTDAAILAHLTAENAYTDAMLAHVKPLQDKLYAEITARIRQDDVTVPYRKRGYWYYKRFDAGEEYPVHARKAGSLQADEEVLLDLDELARGHDFYDVAELEVSPDNRLLAYAEDTVGRRQYTLRFKDLTTGRVLPDTIHTVVAAMQWSADGRAVLYIEKAPQTLLGS